MKQLSLLVFVLACLNGQAQIEITDIIINPRIAQEYQTRMQKMKSQPGLKMVSLPFIDDFSKDHFPGNEAGNEVLWEDLTAYRNISFGFNPPTIGVVTFDGLDETGYPHNEFLGNDYGPADTLTSVPIDLSSGDNIYISFFSQSGGYGNYPENIDSLVLEFYNTDTDHWDWQWSRPGVTNMDFQQTILPVENAAYLQSDFQFRFRNYGTLDGSFDHWNIDFVRLAANRSAADTLLVDVCFASPIYSLLKNDFTQMPWEHYKMNPQSMMVETKPVVLRNLKNAAGALINQTEVTINYEGVQQINFIDFEAPSIQPLSDQVIVQEINSNPNNYFYAPSVDEDWAEFNINVKLSSSPNLYPDNDEMNFKQTFLDYYDYSDHSAESNFGLGDFPGNARIASKVTAITSDSLIALQIAFFPSGINSENVNIFMSIWDDDGLNGGPGTLLYQSEDIQHPEFVGQVDGFAIYPLGEKVFVDESYYIGFKQTSPIKATVGIDMNTTLEGDRLYYSLDDNWIPSGINNVAMMRAQYDSNLDIVGVQELSLNSMITVFPNPVSNQLYISNTSALYFDKVVFFDALGNVVKRHNIKGNEIDVQELSQGMYIMTLVSEKTNQRVSKKIIIVRGK